ncbi:hypothetical protein ACVIGB_001023 [Bradyrhizobium sp. USDA 4341]
MPAPQHHSDDPVARPFHAQIALVHLLIEANRARAADTGSSWDDWFDRISRLPSDAQAYFLEPAAAVFAIEAAAGEIVTERDKLPDIRDAAMFEKIGQLAAASAASGLPLGERIASDFSAFSAWRKAHLDGIDCDMFSLIDQRKPSAKPRRGERRPLFDALFITWAKTASVPLQQAEAAARTKREADAELEATQQTPWMPRP